MSGLRPKLHLDRGWDSHLDYQRTFRTKFTCKENVYGVHVVHTFYHNILGYFFGIDDFYDPT